MTDAEFGDLLTRFTAAVEAGDGGALGRLFAADGVYHDMFYGAFTGPGAIGDMLENHFHRDAQGFHWDMVDPVCDGRLGYSAWRFSYTSCLPDSVGRRVVFEGMSRFEIEGGLIRRYEEAADAGQAFVQLGMAPQRIARILGRFSADTVAAARDTRHLDPARE